MYVGRHYASGSATPCLEYVTDHRSPTQYVVCGLPNIDVLEVHGNSDPCENIDMQRAIAGGMSL